MRQAGYRLRCAALAVAAAIGVEGAAQAQTEDYFNTPWIGAEKASNATSGAGATQSGAGNDLGPSVSSLYGRVQAQSQQNSLPWRVSEHVGIDEILTDNSDDTANDRTVDLGSLFSAGLTATADTPRLNGIFSATGIYRREIENTSLNRFGGYGYTRGQFTVIPDTLYFDVRGSADGVSREGGGLQNVLAQQSQETQVYQILGSPYLYTRADDVGINLLRYQIGQVWFDRNTGAQLFPGFSVGPISSSTNQVAREDFKMAGTVLPRLLSDVSLSVSENDSGALGSGDFTRDRGELVNEYEVTRSTSIIGGAGYERLHDNEFPDVDGEGLVWDVGGRVRPNADSYVLLTYGNHDLRSDFAGELVWRLTPLSDIYAAYTDSITNGQQVLIASNDASELGPEGSLTHVSFDQSTVIGTLDDALLNAAPGGGASASVFGVPLADLNNALPLENGLFRVKAVRASAHSLFENAPLILTVLHVERTQLTSAGQFGGSVGRVETSQGAILSWHPELTKDLFGVASLTYEHVNLGDEQSFLFNNPTDSDHYGAGLGLSWAITKTLAGVVRYDFIYRESHPSSINSYDNILTIGLHKVFN
jgi:hypothetical protein